MGFFSDLWDNIKSTATKIYDSGKSVVDKIKDGAKWVLDKAGSGLSWVNDKISDLKKLPIIGNAVNEFLTSTSVGNAINQGLQRGQQLVDQGNQLIGN